MFFCFAVSGLLLTMARGCVVVRGCVLASGVSRVPAGGSSRASASPASESSELLQRQLGSALGRKSAINVVQQVTLEFALGTQPPGIVAYDLRAVSVEDLSCLSRVGGLAEALPSA